MPRPKAPPTPIGSTDLKGLEKVVHFADMESMFRLPPPALRSTEGGSSSSSSNHATKGNIPRDQSGNSTTSGYSQSTPPISPQDKPLSTSPRHKRTASGAVKTAQDPATGSGPSNNSSSSSSSYTLPPPPSRARKIIQMKPKSARSPDSDASYQPPTSAASAASNSGTKATGASANSKRKQPSATSAAGRKIARKTAHSIIERRRRSKMNEEFGVLKDMIPACEGVEMHKLAILQAGIEYVRYLEGCVAQLKGENEKQSRTLVLEQQSHPRHREADAELDAEENEEDEEVEEEEEGEEDDDDDERDEDQHGREAEVPAEAVRPSKVGKHSKGAVVSGDKWQYRDARRSPLASSLSSSSARASAAHTSSRQDSYGRTRPGQLPPYSKSPSQVSTYAASSTPTPTLLSPAFNAIHFSPDLTRTPTGGSTGGASLVASASATSSSSWTTVNPSPGLAPLPSPKAALNLPLPVPTSAAAVMTHLQLPQPHSGNTAHASQSQHEREAHSKSPAALSDSSGTAEATAGAALMMLTNEWRGSVSGASGPASEVGERGKAMSVRDLLSS